MDDPLGFTARNIGVDGNQQQDKWNGMAKT
jgi:hypothetical protein